MQTTTRTDEQLEAQLDDYYIIRNTLHNAHANHLLLTEDQRNRAINLLRDGGINVDDTGYVDAMLSPHHDDDHARADLREQVANLIRACFLSNYGHTITADEAQAKANAALRAKKAEHQHLVDAASERLIAARQAYYEAERERDRLAREQAGAERDFARDVRKAADAFIARHAIERVKTAPQLPELTVDAFKAFLADLPEDANPQGRMVKHVASGIREQADDGLTLFTTEARAYGSSKRCAFVFDAEGRFLAAARLGKQGCDPVGPIGSALQLSYNTSFTKADLVDVVRAHLARAE